MKIEFLKRLYNASIITVIICLFILLFSNKIPGMDRQSANILYGMSIVLFFVVNGVYETKKGMITAKRFLIVLGLSGILSIAIALGFQMGLKYYTPDKFYLPFLIGVFFIIPWNRKRATGNKDYLASPKPTHKKKKKK